MSFGSALRKQSQHRRQAIPDRVKVVFDQRVHGRLAKALLSLATLVDRL